MWFKVLCLFKGIVQNEFNCKMYYFKNVIKMEFFFFNLMYFYECILNTYVALPVS